MGRQVYLTDNEVRVLNDALYVWDYETPFTGREDWVRDAHEALQTKLHEGNMIKP